MRLPHEGPQRSARVYAARVWRLRRASSDGRDGVTRQAMYSLNARMGCSICMRAGDVLLRRSGLGMGLSPVVRTLSSLRRLHDDRTERADWLRRVAAVGLDGCAEDSRWTVVAKVDEARVRASMPARERRAKKPALEGEPGDGGATATSPTAAGAACGVRRERRRLAIDGRGAAADVGAAAGAVGGVCIVSFGLRWAAALGAALSAAADGAAVEAAAFCWAFCWAFSAFSAFFAAAALLR